jgi:hypothetical protein
MMKLVLMAFALCLISSSNMYLGYAGVGCAIIAGVWAVRDLIRW